MKKDQDLAQNNSREIKVMPRFFTMAKMVIVATNQYIYQCHCLDVIRVECDVGLKRASSIVHCVRNMVQGLRLSSAVKVWRIKHCFECNSTNFLRNHTNFTANTLEQMSMIWCRQIDSICASNITFDVDNAPALCTNWTDDTNVQSLAGSNDAT